MAETISGVQLTDISLDSAETVAAILMADQERAARAIEMVNMLLANKNESQMEGLAIDAARQIHAHKNERAAKVRTELDTTNRRQFIRGTLAGAASIAIPGIGAIVPTAMEAGKAKGAIEGYDMAMEFMSEAIAPSRNALLRGLLKVIENYRDPAEPLPEEGLIIHLEPGNELYAAFEGSEELRNVLRKEMEWMVGSVSTAGITTQLKDIRYSQNDGKPRITVIASAARSVG